MKIFTSSFSSYLCLFLILLLGLFLRVYSLSNNPPGFFCDEASIGFNAYSILTTGKDEFGEFFPIFFKSLGDYKMPIAIYSTIPFISIFGMTEWSVRLQEALYGVALLFILFLIGKLHVSTMYGLCSSFLAAVTPWLIHYNRIAFEYSSYLAFFYSGLLLWFYGMTQKKFLLLAYTIFGLTLYTHNPAKLTIPVLLIGLLSIYRKQVLHHKKTHLIGGSLFIILCIPTFLSFYTGAATARFNQVSVFTKHAPTSEIVLTVIKNYVTQISPQTLYGRADVPFITRHFFGGDFIPMLFVTFPFLIIGIITICVTHKNKFSQVLLLLLLIYPLGAAVSADAPSSSRTIIGAPVLLFITALGMRTFFALWHTQIIKGIIVLAFTVNIFLFLNFYFSTYRRISANFWGWQYGAGDVIAYFENQKNNYDEFYLQGVFNAPEIFFKFYAPDGCGKCRIGSPTDAYNPNKKQLYAISSDYKKDNPDVSFSTIKTLLYPDGSPAFYIGTASLICYTGQYGCNR